MLNISLLAVNRQHYLAILLLQTAVLSLLSTFRCFSSNASAVKIDFVACSFVVN